MVRKQTPSYQLREKQEGRAVTKIKYSKCTKILNNLLRHVMHSSKIYLQNRKIQIKAIKCQHLWTACKVFQSQTELKTTVEIFRNAGFHPVTENCNDIRDIFPLPFSFPFHLPDFNGKYHQNIPHYIEVLYRKYSSIYRNEHHFS